MAQIILSLYVASLQGSVVTYNISFIDYKVHDDMGLHNEGIYNLIVRVVQVLPHLLMRHFGAYIT